MKSMEIKLKKEKFRKRREVFVLFLLFTSSLVGQESFLFSSFQSLEQVKKYFEIVGGSPKKKVEVKSGILRLFGELEGKEDELGFFSKKEYGKGNIVSMEVVFRVLGEGYVVQGREVESPGDSGGGGKKGGGIEPSRKNGTEGEETKLVSPPLGPPKKFIVEKIRDTSVDPKGWIGFLGEKEGAFFSIAPQQVEVILVKDGKEVERERLQGWKGKDWQSYQLIYEKNLKRASFYINGKRVYTALIVLPKIKLLLISKVERSEERDLWGKVEGALFKSIKFYEK